MSEKFLEQLSFLLDSTNQIDERDPMPDLFSRLGSGAIKKLDGNHLIVSSVTYDTQANCDGQNLLAVRGSFDKNTINKGTSGIEIDVDGLTQNLLQFRENKTSNLKVITEALDWLGMEKTSPLYKSGVALAEKADALTSNAYHNADHLRDVTILTFNLLAIRIIKEKILSTYDNTQKNINYQLNNAQALLSNQEKEIMGLTIIAALSHDLEHDGIGNMRVENGEKKYEPLYLEKIAASVAATEMAKQGVEPVLIHAMEAMIYTTDTNEGYKILKNPQLARNQKNIDKEVVSQLLNPVVIDMSCILRDADILGSSGLTAKYVENQTRNLSNEIHFNIDSKGFGGFLEKMVEKYFSEEGQVFEANRQYLINLNKARINSANKDEALQEFEAKLASGNYETTTPTKKLGM